MPATAPAPMSLKLSSEARERLRTLAELKKRPAHALVREAVMNYIEAEETQERRNREAQAAWKHYQDTGSYYDGDDTIAWLRSLSTPIPLPKPRARCEK
jgi:predicted transcriptional regulator